jgi:hypothetical protein
MINKALDDPGGRDPGESEVIVGVGLFTVTGIVLVSSVAANVVAVSCAIPGLTPVTFTRLSVGCEDATFGSMVDQFTVYAEE